MKSAGILGSLTLVSRVLGMVRDIVSARAFGTNWQWDAFVYAFMIPNFFRRLVGEGALSGAFIPVYSGLLTQKGQKEAFRFVNVLGSFLIVFFLIALFAVEGVLVFALDKGGFPERFELILDLLRFFFPYLVLMSFYALGMGVLNSHRLFFAPSVGPVLLNVLWIAGVLWVSSREAVVLSVQLRWLSWFIVAAGVLQIAFELPYLKKIGFRAAWIWDTACPELRKMGRLLLPVVLGFAVMQINLLVDMTLSFWVGAGANSSLWYGNRLMQLPLGVFAIAMGTALLPAISQDIAGGKRESAREHLSFSLRIVFFIILPCAAGLMLLAEPIVRILFERGEFDAESTQRTSRVLFCYSVGLFAYAGQKMVTAGFYASEDTRTPVKIAVIALIANLGFNLILMHYLGEAGLALATSISGVLQFVLLMVFFHKRRFSLPFREIALTFSKVAVASACMAGLALLVQRWLLQVFPRAGMADQAVRLGLTMTAAVFFYLGFCYLFKVRELRKGIGELLRLKSSRKGKSS